MTMLDGRQDYGNVFDTLKTELNDDSKRNGVLLAIRFGHLNTITCFHFQLIPGWIPVCAHFFAAFRILLSNRKKNFSVYELWWGCRWYNLHSIHATPRRGHWRYSVKSVRLSVIVLRSPVEFTREWWRKTCNAVVNCNQISRFILSFHQCCAIPQWPSMGTLLTHASAPSTHHLLARNTVLWNQSISAILIRFDYHKENICFAKRTNNAESETKPDRWISIESHLSERNPIVVSIDKASSSMTFASLSFASAS